MYKDYIKQSKLTLIAYDTISERTVNEILSEFCNSSDYSSIDDITNNITQFTRDVKLNSILSVEGKSHIVINISQARGDANLHKMFNLIRDINTPVILLTKLYISLARSMPNYSLKGGQKALYEASLAISIIDNEIKIDKNRYI